MKYLGIDYGTKRIGLAISDDLGSLAFPKSTLTNTQNVIHEIITIIDNENIDAVVIGKSLNAQGEENQVQKYIKVFITKLSQEKEGIKIIEQDERGSSIAAASHLFGKGNIANARWTGKDNKKKREHNDAHAASIILQRYLDKK